MLNSESLYCMNGEFGHILKHQQRLETELNMNTIITHPTLPNVLNAYCVCFDHFNKQSVLKTSLPSDHQSVYRSKVPGHDITSSHVQIACQLAS